MRPVVVGFSLLLVACAGTGPPPAGDPLADYGLFLDALRTGDVEAALARSWQAKDLRLREAAEARLHETAELLGNGTLRIDAVEARGEGRWVLIVLRLTQAAPAGELSILREELLLGVEGRWLVVARSLRGGRELRRDRDASYEILLEWFRASEPDLSQRWLHES